jgi:hydroxyatrazine ethylaminohydrolase
MIPDAMCETTKQYIDDCKRIIKKYHDTSEFSMHQIVMAPCQPMNCYAETFTETVKLARENNVRMHTHMYEGEANIMLDKFGKRTFEWLEDLDFVGPDVWIAHGWEIKPEEYKKFGDLEVGVSYCPAPATMSAIGEIPNMSEMIKNNMTISMGCDGQASNDGSNLLDSLRLCYVMQMNRRHATGVCVDPYEILKMATVNGAKTLGRDDIGSLEVGKAADLFMIDTNTLELAGALHDPKAIIMTVGLTGNLWLTMINGKIVFSDGKLVGIDESKLAKEAEAECNNSIRKQCPAFDEYNI